MKTEKLAELIKEAILIQAYENGASPQEIIRYIAKFSTPITKQKEESA